jgi:serine/threonine-protein kinase
MIRRRAASNRVMVVCSTCDRELPDEHRFCPHDGTVLLSEPVDPLLGQTLLGQFELREVIGEGATGTVYRAWQAPMERWVAVKVLHRDLTADPSMVARMAREARAVARLTHPGIVTVHATGEAAGGRPFLVMELVDGASLEELAPDEPMAPLRAVDLVRQIVSALAVSHAAGVVHRDLKLDNVMVTRVRRDEIVKVLDFGIAKLMAVSGRLIDGDGQLTADGVICGTPHYIAPEQASGDDVDHRADLYSVGVILYRLVTGRLPFDGHPVAVLLGHVQDEPPPAERLAPIGRRLAAIIRRCMTKRPDDRYQTADELAEDLEAARRALEPSWTEVSPTVAIDDQALPVGATARLPVRRGARFAARALGLLVAALIGAGTTTALRERADRPAAAAVADRAVSRPDPAGDPPSALTEPETADAVSAVDGPPRRTVVVGEGGYSMRLSLPVRIVAGVDYEIALEVWDPDGEPIATSEMILTVDDPGGNSRGVAAKPTRDPGRYRFNRTFADAGAYQLKVFPPAGGTAIAVFVEVVDPAAPAS